MDAKDEIKSKIDIVEYIGRQVVLKPAGRTLKGLCPFHSEKTPSFVVSAERQSFKCFGCREGGDIFSFYMKKEGVDFHQALKELAQEAGVTLEYNNFPKDFHKTEVLLNINNLSAQFYHYLLTQHTIGKKALEYLKERGLTTQQIKDFQLGYAPNDWQTLVNYLQGKKFQEQDLIDTGLVIKSKNNRLYDRFRGRAMFPLKDHRGNLVGFSGRILPWVSEEDGNAGKYINSPETSLYHKSQLLFPIFNVKDDIRKDNQVVIVEGEMDALASIRANVRNVVAVKGSALTIDQVKLLKRYCQTLILALDADNAGIAAAKRAIPIAQQLELKVRVIYIPEGKDPDELVKNDPKLWRKLVKTSIPVFDFLLLMSCKQNDVTTLEGKQTISAQVIPTIYQIENVIEQDHYIKQLAETLRIDAEVIRQELKRYAKKQAISTSNRKVTEVPSQKLTIERVDQLANQLLAIIIQNYPDVDWSWINCSDLPQTAFIKIIDLIKQKQPKDIVSFSKTLPSELQEAFDESFLLEIDEIKEKNQLKIQIDNLLSQLVKIYFHDKLQRLRTELLSKPDLQESLEKEIFSIITRLRSVQ